MLEVTYNTMCVNYKAKIDAEPWSRSRAKVTAPAPAKYPGSRAARAPLANFASFIECSLFLNKWFRFWF